MHIKRRIKKIVVFVFFFFFFAYYLEFLPLFIGSFLSCLSSPSSVIIIVIISYHLSLSAPCCCCLFVCLLLGLLLLTSGLAGALPVASPRPPSAVAVLLRPLGPVARQQVVVHERGDHDHGDDDEDVDHHLRDLLLLGEKKMKQQLEALEADPVDQQLVDHLRERRPAATAGMKKKKKKRGGVAVHW
jgi:hypothetical protein